ncbi:MAG: 16S rRNA (uracil(1498)-N(3))-methyltransferase [Gammaproteobacteria bacterium]|nr:16S rRNA (uracil(1498)-N(3))-methyltransferase [Gammaproteobacteria bacterium]
MIFFTEKLSQHGGKIPLTVSQQQHVKANRLALDAQVIFSDQISYAEGTLVVEKKNTFFQYTSTQMILKKHALPYVHLYFGIFKPDRMSWMIEKTTELGVSEFTPLYTDRTQNHYWNNNSISRLESVIESACIQSKQLIKPKLNSPSVLKNLNFQPSDPNQIWYLADIITNPENTDTIQMLPTPAEKICIFIGPEGGWSPAEQGFFPNHIQRIALQGPILRSETAAIAICSIFSYNNCLIIK